MAEKPWNAWRALRARPEVTFARAPLPRSFGGAVSARWSDGTAVIVVDPELGRRERHEAVAHELLHLDLGCCDAGRHPLLEQREEMTVRREVARRCVPIGHLHDYVRKRIASELTVTPLDVSEEFDVTPQLAELALSLLGEIPGGDT